MIRIFQNPDARRLIYAFLVILFLIGACFLATGAQLRVETRSAAAQQQYPGPGTPMPTATLRPPIDYGGDVSYCGFTQAGEYVCIICAGNCVREFDPVPGEVWILK